MAKSLFTDRGNQEMRDRCSSNNYHKSDLRARGKLSKVHMDNHLEKNLEEKLTKSQKKDNIRQKIDNERNQVTTNIMVHDI